LNYKAHKIYSEMTQYNWLTQVILENDCWQQPFSSITCVSQLYWVTSEETLEIAAAALSTDEMRFLTPNQQCQMNDGSYWQRYTLPLTLIRFTLYYRPTAGIYYTWLFTICQLTIDQTSQIFGTGFAILPN